MTAPGPADPTPMPQLDNIKDLLQWAAAHHAVSDTHWLGQHLWNVDTEKKVDVLLRTHIRLTVLAAVGSGLAGALLPEFIRAMMS